MWEMEYIKTLEYIKRGDGVYKDSSPPSDCPPRSDNGSAGALLRCKEEKGCRVDGLGGGGKE